MEGLAAAITRPVAKRPKPARSQIKEPKNRARRGARVATLLLTLWSFRSDLSLSTGERLQGAPFDLTHAPAGSVLPGSEKPCGAAPGAQAHRPRSESRAMK